MRAFIDDVSRGLARSASRREALQWMFGTLAASIAAACGGRSPIAPTRSGFQQCGTIGALYCNSYSIPQTLSDGVAGACCASPNPSVGYLCAYGSNYVAAGCFATLSDARQYCRTAVSIVRCTAA